MAEYITSAEFERFSRGMDDRFEGISNNIERLIDSQADFIQIQTQANQQTVANNIHCEARNEELERQLTSLASTVNEIALTVQSHAPIVEQCRDLKKKYSVIVMAFWVSFFTACGASAYAYIIDKPSKVAVK